MKKTYNLLELSLWILNPILIIAVIFGDQIETGLFLHWLGKMHPLVLHFPIVFGLLISIYFILFSNKRLEVEIEKLVLAINAFLATIVALLGVFLAINGSYEGELVVQHKWGGFAIAFISWIFLYILSLRKGVKVIFAIVFIGVLVGSTHKGAQLTHGVNALSYPKSDQAVESSPIPDQSVYQAAIIPILEAKCISCHGLDRMKGRLRLDSRAFMEQGGKSGALLTASPGEQALILQRIESNLMDKGHMPPEGKQQLSETELTIIQQWVNSGSDFEIRVRDLSKKDPLRDLIMNYTNANLEIALITDRPDLDEFNTDYCSVNYLFYGTDQIEVNFFQASFYDRKTLQKLLKVKDQVVQLNMQLMPLEAADMDLVVQFKNLEKLNLNATGLPFSELLRLTELSKLQSLAICGIKVETEELDQLLRDTPLSSIYLWTDQLESNQLSALTEKYSTVNFTIGDNLSDQILEINSPIINQDSTIIESILEVELKHLLSGVDIYYTTDGSTPDSTKEQYRSPIEISQNTVLKAKAYKKGWLSSAVVQKTFYKSGIMPDTLFLSRPPHQKYQGKGAQTLIDHSLGETNISNGEWLGYIDNDLEFTFGFNTPKKLSIIQVNALSALAPHVFPPVSIVVSASNNGNEFKAISNTDFSVPDLGTPTQAELYSCIIDTNEAFKYFRVRVSNLKSMPDWHAAKGNPAWVFVDEIFLN